MLQRIQSIFLLVSAALGLILFFMPFATFSEGAETYSLTFLGLDITSNGKNFSPVTSMVISSFSGLAVLMPLIAIFLYKKRANQIKMAYLSLAICGGLFATALFYILGIANFVETDQEIITSYGIALVVPLIEMVLVFLAINNINKDEKLIKSLDRLR